ncbi:MAG: bifunctional folylpolyglutamate synthase/dihydrofolate synthase [Alloprevotella sp.]|nr:bifunctional folylpolyglutamate synthase/dihydrofolate synthase [Alloprevotella sp.]
MNYTETIQYLYNATPLFQDKGVGAYKEGLQTTIALDSYLGHPHRLYKTIHVAGTNGKGSCSHTLASVLQVAGYKVGLYTSPHLMDFRERIRVNGQKVSKDFVCDFIEKYRPFFEPLHPSFFELTTAMAFQYFKEEHVDIAVIEVGLGGQLDCTNIISPILSVITNISLDHTQLLGHTLEDIAREKAGIIKPNIPVVIGEHTRATREVFDAVASELEAPIFYAQDNPEVSSSKPQCDGVLYQTRSFGTIKHDLQGEYQARNVNTILVALSHLDLPHVDNQTILQGFSAVQKTTHLLGRWQIFSEKPHIICDTGHNIGGWEYNAKQLYHIDNLHIIFGISGDKEINQILPLLPKHAHYYWTQASVKRALAAEELCQKAKEYGLDGQSFSDVASAFQSARASTTEEATLFIGGSSFVVADFLTFMYYNEN